MNWLFELIRRFRMLLNRRQFNADLEEEMRLHLELRQQEHLESGVAAKDAEAAARRRFGNATYLREESHIAWGWAWLEHLAADVRYGARVLRKSSGFSAIAILTTALGIGASTAIFSVVEATLLRPLPYPQPEQLVSIQADFPGVGAQDVGMSQPEWQDLQRSGIFEYVSPTWFDENNLTGSSQPARVRLLLVAPNYFALLGVKPQLGRIFNAEDHSPGLTLEVLISDGLWKRAFGSDPQIVNKSLRLETDAYRVVGVMPPGFDAPGRIAEERDIDVWAATSFYGMPLPDNPPRNQRYLPTAIARLKPGLTVAQAQSRLDALVASLQKQFPGDYPAQNAWTLRLVPLQERVVGNVRQSLLFLLGAVGLVLLIGCVNVANLLLARASTRGREMAVRRALGAARKRFIAQLLTESSLLSLLGGVLGLAILYSARTFLIRLVPESLPRLNNIAIHWSVLAFTVVLSLASGAIFGLAPALHAGRMDLVQALKEAMRGSTGSSEQARTRHVLVIAEFALSLTLMIAAGLLLRSFWELQRVPLGFNPQNVVAVRTRLNEPNDPKADPYLTADKEAPFLREVLRRVRTLAGVEEVAVGDTASIPLDARLQDLKVISEGKFFITFEGRDTQADEPSVVDRSSVTPDYFHLLGISLLRGRVFNDSDNDKAPHVAIINEAFARTYWPDGDALGKRFKRNQAGSPWITVVGVVADARTASLLEPSAPQAYFNIYQTGAKRLAIFLRGHFDTAVFPEQVREQVQSVNPTLPISGTQTLTETVYASLSARRFSMYMIASFALTALLLAALGIYGVLSYTITERTHEIGIRVALGAQRLNILRIVVGQGMSLALTGAAVGLVGSVVVSKMMAGALYGVRPTDPLTFAGVALLLIGVALLACYVPARRATRVDPLVALRHE